MTVRLYADEYRCAIFEEAPGGGDPLDPASFRNRPALNPTAWLPNIFFHSDFDYYGVVASNLSISVSHSAVVGITTMAAGGTGEVSAAVRYQGQDAEQDQLLLRHDLGYVPRFFAVVNGRMAPSAMPIQYLDVNRTRFASVYATATEIRVRTLGSSSDQTLPAITATYGVLVFRTPAPVPGEKMLYIDPTSVIFGQGKFRGSEPHLRVVGQGDTNFAIATRRTGAIRNGGFRSYLPNGTYFDYGSFNGVLPAPTFINVTAGV